MASPLKFSVGRRNTRTGDTSSGAFLARQLEAEFKELVSNFEDYFSYLEGELPEALKEALEPTFEKSKEYCPKDTGALVKSGYLEVRKFHGGSRVEMGYARGGNPDYAVFVHEMTDFYHEAPTQAKWLQTAVDEDYFNILQRVTDKIKEASGI